MTAEQTSYLRELVQARDRGDWRRVSHLTLRRAFAEAAEDSLALLAPWPAPGGDRERFERMLHSAQLATVELRALELDTISEQRVLLVKGISRRLLVRWLERLGLRGGLFASVQRTGGMWVEINERGPDRPLERCEPLALDEMLCRRWKRTVALMPVPRSFAEALALSSSSWRARREPHG